MDPWQSSVEKRLDSLDRRLTAIETSTTEIKVSVAEIKRDVAHLPGKGFIVSIGVIGLTVLSLVVGVLANLDRIFG